MTCSGIGRSMSRRVGLGVRSVLVRRLRRAVRTAAPPAGRARGTRTESAFRWIVSRSEILHAYSIAYYPTHCQIESKQCTDRNLLQFCYIRTYLKRERNFYFVLSLSTRRSCQNDDCVSRITQSSSFCLIIKGVI